MIKYVGVINRKMKIEISEKQFFILYSIAMITILTIGFIVGK